MSNPRFAEYVTSGAFTLTLSRHQIARLAMIANGGEFCFNGSDSSLERKGLIIVVPKPNSHDPERVEVRATFAGLVCINLLREAGLTNHGNDAIANEIVALQKEIGEQRRAALDADERAWSALARKEKVERELAAAIEDNGRLATAIDCQKMGITLRKHPLDPGGLVTRKDKLPHLSDAELCGPASTSGRAGE